MDSPIDSLLQRSVRIRPDICWYLFSESQPATWVARDPVSLEYFHFSEREKSVACLLDGSRTLADILETHPRLAPTASWLLQLVSKLENACFCVPRDAAAGRRLWHGRLRQQNTALWQKLLSPIAIRVKLFDPTQMLNQLAWLANGLFSKPFFIGWCLCAIPLGFLCLMQCLRSPGNLLVSLTTLTSSRAIGLIAVYVVVKSIHELGHALACKRWRAECHEIGLFFLVFTPILYCDVSDSWKLPNRWRRASVAAAGIYIELILATVASAVWLTTAPATLVNLIAANVMLVCSANTILVNANPLLKYDGYYALSDLWGVPNLAEQGREAAWAVSQSMITADRLPSHRWDASAKLLAAYGIASWLYRQFVIVVIAWVVWMLLDGIGFRLMGALFIVLMAVNVIRTNVTGAVRWTQELAVTGGLRGLGLLRFLGLLALIGCVAYAFFYLPLPTYVAGRGVTELSAISPVYAKQSGTLENFAKIGDTLPAGSPIATIASIELEMEHLDTAGQIAVLQQRMAQLELLSVDTESAATQLANTAAELAKAEDRLQILDQELRSLVVVAEVDGKLLGGRYQTFQPMSELPDQQRLTPVLDQQHVGRGIRRGQMLGWFGSTGAFQLTAYVAEHDAQRLWQGMSLGCRWDCEPGTRFAGTVVRIAPEPILEIPEALIGDESILPRTGSGGASEPAVPHYEVKIAMESMPLTLGHASLANVYFQTAPETLYRSLQRLFDLTVRPDL